MLQTQLPRKHCTPLRTYEHDRLESLPNNVVNDQALIAFEKALLEKGMLRAHGTVAETPLSFLIDTEKNVFLWRNGFSLSEKASFEFWFDLDLLLGKRLSQLKELDPANPFTSFGFGLGSTEPEAALREKNYLEDFAEHYQRLRSHLEALSQVGARLLREECHEAPKELVILPVKKNLRAYGKL